MTTMKDELDNIVNEINMHTNWSKNAKIRYAYISLGKIVQKDAMFFYTIQNNLLSKDKEDIRYTRDEIERIIGTENLFDYKVVCRNSADMLAYILKKAGIQCEVRKTIVYTQYKDLMINHYFVVATGDNDKKYFMTLNPDLPNIKLGRKTSKFAYEIAYMVPSIFTDSKKDEQYYEGEEVDYSILSDEEIRALDEEIGYVDNKVMQDDDSYSLEYTDYFFDALKEAYKNNKDYLNSVCYQTNFYHIVSKLLNNGLTLDKVLMEKPSLNKENENYLDFKISDVPSSTWEDLKKYVLNRFISKVYKEYKISSDVDFEELLENKNYEEIRKTFNKELASHSNKKEINKLGYINPFFVMKKMIDLFYSIDKFKSNDLKDGELKNNKQIFSNSLNSVALFFVDRRLLPNEGSLSSTYLTNKLVYAFNNIFDIGHKTLFNTIGLAQQVVIIKEILEIVLNDLNKKDFDLPNYNEKKSPLRNRILSTVLFKKDSKMPFYLIYVKNTKYGDNANAMLVYDLINNELYLDQTPIDIISDYYVIKDADLKLIIEEFNSKDVEETDNFKL